jgi:hypothetical protein
VCGLVDEVARFFDALSGTMLSTNRRQQLGAQIATYASDAPRTSPISLYRPITGDQRTS